MNIVGSSRVRPTVSEWRHKQVELSNTPQ